MPACDAPTLLTPEQLFCLCGCRSYKQYYEMRKGFESGACAFCQIDKGLNQVLFENDFWLIWEVPSQFLRKELALHLMIVPKQHVRFPWELPAEATRAKYACWEWIEEHYADRIEGGIIATRIGDMRLNAGTVPHMHTNVYVPKGTAEFRIPVFKDPSDAAENALRAAEFSTRYEAGEVPA
ncbi:hypothetical protein K2X96_02225 [Patescibacteria group bacterium]|nr:hypothetical protein [Patescibacteria group bacterium]